MNQINIKYIFIDTQDNFNKYIRQLNANNDPNVHIIFEHDNWDDFTYKSTFNISGWANHKLMYLSDYFKIMKIEKKISYHNILEKMQADKVLNREFSFNDSTLKTNNYISISDCNFKENILFFCSFAFMNELSRFDTEDLKNNFENLINSFMDSIQNVSYNASLSSNKLLNHNKIFERSILRDFKMYNLNKINRLDVLKLKDNYLKQLDNIEKEINTQNNSLSKKSLLFLALSQMEQYLKDIIQLKLNLINKESNDNEFINNAISEYRNKQSNWNGFNCQFKLLYNITPSEFIGDGKIPLHILRNKIAHHNNEVSIKENELQCDNSVMAIDKIIGNIRGFINKTCDRLVNSELVI